MWANPEAEVLYYRQDEFATQDSEWSTPRSHHLLVLSVLRLAQHSIPSKANKVHAGDRIALVLCLV